MSCNDRNDNVVPIYLNNKYRVRYDATRLATSGGLQNHNHPQLGIINGRTLCRIQPSPRHRQLRCLQSHGFFPAYLGKVIASCGQDGKIALHSAQRCQDRLL